jgi:hypothetical protein
MYHSVTAMVGAGVSGVTSSRQCSRCYLQQPTRISGNPQSCSRQQQPGWTQLGCFPPGAAQSRILLGLAIHSITLQATQAACRCTSGQLKCPATHWQAQLTYRGCLMVGRPPTCQQWLTSLVACCPVHCAAAGAGTASSTGPLRVDRWRNLSGVFFLGQVCERSASSGACSNSGSSSGGSLYSHSSRGSIGTAGAPVAVCGWLDELWHLKEQMQIAG